MMIIIIIPLVIMIITIPMQVDSCDKLATDQVEASKPYWDTQVLMIVVMMIIMGHHDHDHNDDGG